MNKNDLIAAIARESDLSITDARHALKAIIVVITAALAPGDSVKQLGLGCFGVITRAARMGRYPRSGLAIHIDTKRAPGFSPAKAREYAQKVQCVGAPPRPASR
mgnify:CR=1 FL=1